MTAFDDVSGMNPIHLVEGILARTVEGDSCSLALVELDPDSILPEHSHLNEQLGMVIRGSVSFRVGEETRDLGPGGTWRIPPHTPHEVRTGPEGAVVVDVFSPAREAWKALERSPAQEPLWP